MTIKFALAILLGASSLAMAQTPCIDGMAGNYPCQNVTLLGHLTTDDLLADQDGGVYLNDIWGWTDPVTDREYAIVGMVNGTSFVDITDPTSPIMLGILPEHHAAETASKSSAARGGNSIWRDIKVYKNHAFVVSEDNTHGMQVFDLTNLRDLGTPAEPLTFAETAHYGGVGDAHNIVINEESGFAYIVGATGASTCGGGGLHVVNIQNPANPVYENCFDLAGYTHDAQCVIYNGPDEKYAGKEICFNANEETIAIVDVDDKSSMTLISKVGYEGVTYAHQGWLTEDHKYFVSNDEADEWEKVTDKTKTFIWDVQDLDEPKLIQVYEHTTGSIDHNLYIAGDKMYQSNYASGLRVFDVSKVAHGFIRETGYFDTYPAAEGLDWSGSWSNYPFFESGTIAVSDQTNGLFLLKEEYTSNYIVHEPTDFDGCIEEEFNVWFEIAGEGLTFQWQYDVGSGFEDIDDSNDYSGILTNMLTINAGHSVADGIDFRCVASDGDTQYVSQSAKVTVQKKPTAAFEYDQLSNHVTFSNQSTDAETYEWDFGDGSSKTNIESPSHIYPRDSQAYNVVLIAVNDCGSNTVEETLNLIIAESDRVQNQMTIYPNPATSYIQIRTGTSGAAYNYSILNTGGQAVLQGRIVSGQQQSIDATVLVSGIYVLELENELGNRTRQKIYIQ